MPIVSVIVPIYNAAAYLHECVDSILAQTVTDLEVILVDDGSTDESPAICDEYEKADTRVRVIHKPNGRAASARNAGLAVASGEYVAFVDADDWIDPAMYGKMAAQNADVCLCDYVRFDGEKEYPFTQPNVAAGYYDRESMIKHIFPHLVMDGVEFPITISNCVLLIRRSILADHHLSYREDILVSEDAPFGSEALYCAGSFAYLKGEFLYHYRISPESASKKHKDFWWPSFLKINEETENYFGTTTDYDFTQQIKSNMFYLARAEIYYILTDKTLSFSEQNNAVRKVMNDPRVIRMMDGLDVSAAPLSLKCIYWSIRYRSIPLRRLISLVSCIRGSMKRA